MSALARIAGAAELGAIDVQLAALLRRLARAEHADVVELTAALVSRERDRGHPCIDLARWAGRPIAERAAQPAGACGDASVAALPALPPFDEWVRTLRASGLAGTGETPTPLVVDAAGRCYLHRYWSAERRLARRVAELAASAPDFDAAPFAPLFRDLFPPPEDAETDWQAVAAAAVLRGRLAVIGGGPGTGKTTTVARMLALLAARDPAIRIALAAPTGKAAARLTESIRAQAGGLRAGGDVRALLLGVEARTLHRLLGFLPSTGAFRHDARRPLACDVLVVDEASMIDLLVMDALLDAVPPHARVVLVGDKDQLASVEAGFVFGDVCEAANSASYSDAFARDFAALSGRRADFRDVRGRTVTAAATGTRTVGATARAPSRAEAAPSAGAGRLRDSAVELQVAWRFRDKPGIGAIAAAVRAGDADRALAVLADPAAADVRGAELPAAPDSLVASVGEALEAVAGADGAEEALERLARVRILCAANAGRWGVESLNRIAERRLADAGHATTERWYRGRPVLVTRNDYAVALFNGDVGVCMPAEDGRMRVWFAGASGVRSVSPAKLPEHQTAWAMTVHKSQGSEFDRVVLVLPDRDSPLLTRELVYTAVTRARGDVAVFAPHAILRAAIARQTERVSGLRDLLSARR
jgi:exodeoxyribonuclease V alpha subunit